MSILSAKELRDKSEIELRAEALRVRKDLVDLRLKHAAKQLETPADLRLRRRELARVLTEQRKREGEP